MKLTENYPEEYWHCHVILVPTLLSGNAYLSYNCISRMRSHGDRGNEKRISVFDSLLILILSWINIGCNELHHTY